MRLHGGRYEQIERKVVELFSKLNVSKAPIDVFEIVKALGIKLVKYSEIQGASEQKMAISKDGFCFEFEVSENESYWVIAYNDKMPPKRIRFTIMHEVGHIVLDHSEHSELAESEANYFAKYSLAPPPLIHKFDPEDYVEVADIFDISNECAMYALSSYNKWLRYGKEYFLDYEIKLLSLFGLAV